MKKMILLTGVLFCILNNLSAQAVIARKNGNLSYFHYLTPPYSGTQLQNIITNLAQSGDTLYLPGETFTFSANMLIDKKLVIIGTGIHPDSVSAVQGAQATVFDQKNFTINITATQGQPGASGTEIHGIRFENGGAIRLGQGNNNTSSYLSNLKFVRCHLESGYNRIYLGITNNSPASNILIKQCVIRGSINVFKATNVSLIANVLFEGFLDNGTSSTYVNNNLIFNYENNSYCNGVHYNNNIFTRNNNNLVTVFEPSQYHDNLWLFLSGGSIAFDAQSINNNNLSRTIENVFTSLDPLVQNPLTTFSFKSDYHLNPAHDNYTQFSNMNNSGPVGLFGSGENRWKEGILPFNPHWRFFPNGQLGNTSNGLLNISIKAGAQQE